MRWKYSPISSAEGDWRRIFGFWSPLRADENAYADSLRDSEGMIEEARGEDS